MKITPSVLDQMIRFKYEKIDFDVLNPVVPSN